MVKMRQRNLAVFEFEKGTQQEILAYIKHNIDFMRNHCVAFHFDVDSEFADFLHSLQIDFFKVCNENLFKTKMARQVTQQNEIQAKKNDSQKEVKTQTFPTKKIKITFDSTNEKQVVMQTLDNDQSDGSITQEKTDCIPSHELTLSHNIILQKPSIAQDTESQQPLNTTEENKNTLSSNISHFSPIINSSSQNSLNLAYAKNVEAMEFANCTNIICSKSLSSIVFKRAIRSGEELILDSHATFLKSINVGAMIKSYGNLQVYGKCDGILECFGDFIIIKEFSMGRISLQSINLEGNMLEKVQQSQKLKMLVIENNQIEMIELS